MIEQAGLAAVARRKAGGFSLGMRQRLGIAAALLGDPPVLMLDEPFNGMDPEGIVWMRGFLRSLAARGPGRAGVQPPDERTGGHRRPPGDRRPRPGHRRHQRARDLLAAASGDRVTLRTDAPRAGGGGAGSGGGRRRRRRRRRADRRPGCQPSRWSALLGGTRSPFSEVSAHRATLEEAYLELTSDAVEYRAATGAAADDRHQPPQPAGRAGRADGFGRLLQRRVDQVPTVRGWVIGMIIAAAGHRRARAARPQRVRRRRSCPGGAGPARRVRLRRPGRAGRRGGERQLLLRAPADWPGTAASPSG